MATFTKDINLGTTSGTYGSTGTLRLTVVENSQSVANNTTNVTATLQFIVSPYNWRASSASWSLSGYKSASGSLVSMQYYTGTTTLWTETFDVEHESDGSKTISFDMSFTSTYTYSGSGSLSCTLTTIPRYTSITSFTVSQRDETSFTFNWKTADTIDYAWYSTDNGSNWTGYNVADGTSGSFTVSGLSANTSYNCKLRVRRKDSQLTTDSSKVSQKTYQYPYVSKVGTSSLKIGNSQTLTLYNPLSRSVTVYMKQNSTSGTQLYSGATTGTSITFTPNANTLYNSIPSATKGNAVYYCVYSNQNVQTMSGEYYIDNSGGAFNPTFDTSNWSYAADYTDLTNDDKVVIKGKATITFTVNASATAKSGASITSYKVEWGNKSTTITGTTGSITISGGTDSNLKITAVDSRGYSTPSTISLGDNLVNYIDTTITGTTQREDGIGTDTVLDLSGTFFNSTFGANGVQNTINSLTYYVSTDNATWSSAYTIPVSSLTISDNNVSLNDYPIHADGTSDGFPIGTRYYIKVDIEDTIQTRTLTGILVTDGKIAVDCYQDSNGDYHRGINGLADEKYADYVHGDFGTEGRIYQEGHPAFLPSGDGTDPVFWCSLPNGTYYYAYVVYSSTNMPSNYGFVTKEGTYRTDGGKGDFTVIFQKQATGAIYRTSGNGNTATCVWKELVYTDALSGYLPLSGGTMTGDLYDKNGHNVNGFNGRVSTIDFNKSSTEYGRKRTDIVTSAVTGVVEDPGDGFIETYYWDNSGKYDAQLWLPNGNNYCPKVRSRGNGSSWPVFDFLPKMKVLYDNTSGTTGTVTLNETAANFGYLEVYYGKTSNVFQKIYSPNGKKVSIFEGYLATSTIFQCVAKVMNISGTSMTVVSGSTGYGNTNNNEPGGVASENNIKIYKVVGCRW